MASRGKDRKPVPARVSSVSGISGPRTVTDKKQQRPAATLPLKRTPEVKPSPKNAFHNIDRKGQPELKKQVNLKVNSEVAKAELQVDYEDDFESYESDFEKESDDERLPEKPATVPAAVPPPEEKEVEEFVPEIVEEAEEDERDKESRQTAAHKKETKEWRQKRQSAKIKPTNAKPSDVIFKTMDFSAAIAEQKKQQASSKLRQRATNLLRMVQLDKMEFQLLDIKPMPYDVFIQAYGYMNRRQVGVQTRGDFRSADIQTEDVKERNVWTQHPVDFDPSKAINLESFAKENRGCGTEPDDYANLDLCSSQPVFTKDIQLAADLMTSLLTFNEQRSQKTPNNSTLFENSSEYSVGNQVGAKVSIVKAEPISRHLFATVVNSIDGVSNMCTVSIWSTVTAGEPVKNLFCYGEITAVAFSDPKSMLLTAGTKDGTLYLWNYRAKDDCNGWPTYIAAPHVNGKGHWSQVVAIATPMVISNFAQLSLFCTLDTEGLVNVWTVLPRKTGVMSPNDAELEQDGGLFPGATVHLNLSAKFEIAEIQNSALYWIGFEENSSCHLNIVAVTVRGETMGFSFNINSNRRRIKKIKYIQENGLDKPVTFLTGSDATCFLISTLDGAVYKYKFGSPLPTATWTTDAAVVPNPTLQLIDHKDRLIALTKTKILTCYPDSSRGYTSEDFLHDKDEVLHGEFYFKDTSLYLIVATFRGKLYSHRFI